MHYSVIHRIDFTSTPCLVLGLLSQAPWPKSVQELDEQLKGLVSRLFERLQEKGDLAWQTEINGKSLLVIHCGDAKDYTAEQFKKRIAEVAGALTKHRMVEASIYLPALTDCDADWQLQQTIMGLDVCLYQLLDFKSEDKKPYSLERIQLVVENADAEVVEQAQAICAGVRLTRNLANMPANICTPTYLAEQALTLAQQHPEIKTTVLNQQDMKDMGMGALLSVAQGSVQPPQFIEIHYHGHTHNPPIVLIGKGVTFDSGGISLKPPTGMEEMKFDMAGGASVLGTIKACALMKLPIHVIGLIPTTENMPGGSATKPGDIVTSLSGQTIEIVNTDAEGRLILADALTYAEQFNPAFVVDIATLTGAIIIALGYETNGLFTADQELADAILKAASESSDATCRMPLNTSYQEAIKSPLADMQNSTFDRAAGSITGACFLSRFAKNFRWAHLDIAGTAWVSGKNRQATGRPVPLLVQLLRHAADSR